MSIRIGSETKFDTRGTVFQPEEKTSKNGKTFFVANLSTSRKIPASTEGGEVKYKNSGWRATFVGDAAKKFKELGIKEKDMIELLNAEIENEYVKEKERNYVNLTVYNFKKVDRTAGAPSAPATTSATTPVSGGFMNIPDGIDEELPFN